MGAGIVGIILSAGYLHMTLELPMGEMDQPGAGVFPLLVAGILFVASLSSLWEGWHHRAHSPTLDLPEGSDRTRLLKLIALLLVYFLIIRLLERKGVEEQPAELMDGSETHIAPHSESHGATRKEARNLTVGMVIDGVPESIAVGLTLHTAAMGVSAALVGSIFIAAIPEAIGIAAAMLAGGIAIGAVLLRFSAIVIIGAVFAAIGYTLMSGASDSAQAFIQSIAAGALLVVVIDEMIPIAVRSIKGWAGIIGVAGFVFSAALTWASGG
jgi:zinc transporter ZupT